MPSDTYQVVLTGEVLPDIDRAEAIAGFAALFKLSEPAAAAKIDKAPIIIKKSVDKATAGQFFTRLGKLGWKIDIRAAVSLPAAVAATAPQPGLKFTFTGQPDYAFVTIQIPKGETIKVEASSMATMDVNLQMKTKMKGGISRLLSGESIFVNEFTAEGFDSEIGIAPGTPGDLRHVFLDDQTIYLQNSAFVACTQDIEVESKWQGLTKGFFSGESLFLIRAKGRGDLWFNSYGAIIEIDVTQDYVVDTGNIVAFSEGLDYKVTKVGGYKSLFFSGEGFVCRFSGVGKVWIQTRSTAAFVSWAHAFRPVKRTSGSDGGD
jgi:uncharacterized protein (TIGR00266 family)